MCELSRQLAGESGVLAMLALEVSKPEYIL